MAGGSGEGDLNLVPYMDIMVTLILSMVFTISLLGDDTGFATDEVDVPGRGAGGVPLIVAVGLEGYEVRQGDARLELPREGAEWPTDRLAAVLRDLRDAGEDAPTITVSPEAAVPYRIVIATLDALRADAQGPLFPDVALQLARR
ncbi:MAG: hypothetical protein Q8P41_03135 [Pseudomonadota bacterium]|nr:hypothetical protein [Pseudomonadota bacterium]